MPQELEGTELYSTQIDRIPLKVLSWVLIFGDRRTSRMFFHFYFIFDPDSADTRDQAENAEQAYLAENGEHMILHGGIMSDDQSTQTAVVMFAEFDDLVTTRSFLAENPWKNAGAYKETHINRWTNGLKRTLDTLPYHPGESYWHLRGYGKPGTHARRQEILADHIGYYAPHDPDTILIRGALLDAEVDEWCGSAIVMEKGSREEILTFLAEEPYYVNGLYDHLSIERFQVQSLPD